MKQILKISTLSIAVTVSVLAHAVLLAVHFVAPEPIRFQPTDPGLEVILVNAKHSKKPLKADALAQANLDGGGNASEGRSKSFLTDSGKILNGDNVKTAKHKIEELEEQQSNLLAQMKRDTPLKVPEVAEANKPVVTRSNEKADSVDNSRALARMAAEITQTIEDQNKRPRKTFITPSTQEVGYAMYYKTLQKRIEEMGTLNFPQENGKKLYGELIVYIPIFQDGSIYEKEGGPHIEKSSNNAALDRAALRIVRRSAPFGRFPATMRSADKDDLWIVITRFKFSREEGLETRLEGPPS
ncbi:MAG: TonB C-terminal domain-containing protein [Pseudomonadota bacterium]